MITIVGFAFALLAAAPAASRDTLTFRFIGNMAYAISDGKTTLYTDFPYQSVYSEYRTYDFEAVPKGGDSVCLITHGHFDHFDPSLFPRMDCALIAPADSSRR